jgi:hypothetical protein
MFTNQINADWQAVHVAGLPMDKNIMLNYNAASNTMQNLIILRPHCAAGTMPTCDNDQWIECDGMPVPATITINMRNLPITVGNNAAITALPNLPPTANVTSWVAWIEFDCIEG